MDVMSELTKKVNEVFDINFLTQLAREKQLLKRQRKIMLQQFLVALMMQKVSSKKNSLEQLACELEMGGCSVSKQALHKKFNDKGVSFVQGVLEELLRRTRKEPLSQLETLSFVHDIKIVDSSEVKLNNHLAKRFPQVRKQGAAVKIQALMSGLDEALCALEIRASKEPDQGYKNHVDYFHEGDLYLGDLGYFDVETFRKIEERKAYFLSRYFKKTHLYDLAGERINLRERLNGTKRAYLELDVELGALRFACRCVAIKLPDEAYEKRLLNVRQTKRKDPRSKVDEQDELHRWTIFVTNLPLAMEGTVLLEVYRLRWQIELLFKRMKTFLNLRKVEDKNEHSALMSIYVSLIIMVLLSMATMETMGKEISLYKASHIFMNHLKDFLECIIYKRRCAFTWIRQLLNKFALKECRPRRPSTKQLLHWNAVYA